MEGRNWEYSIIKCLHYLWSGIVLFESALVLVVNVYCKCKGNYNHSKNKATDFRISFQTILRSLINARRNEKQPKWKNQQRILIGNSENGQEHVERVPKLISRKMNIKMTLRDHFIFFRLGRILKTDNAKCCQRRTNIGTYTHCW